jgi:hypothetical protein
MATLKGCFSSFNQPISKKSRNYLILNGLSFEEVMQPIESRYYDIPNFTDLKTIEQERRNRR